MRKCVFLLSFASAAVSAVAVADEVPQPPQSTCPFSPGKYSGLLSQSWANRQRFMEITSVDPACKLAELRYGDEAKSMQSKAPLQAEIVGEKLTYQCGNGGTCTFEIDGKKEKMNFRYAGIAGNNTGFFEAVDKF